MPARTACLLLAVFGLFLVASPSALARPERLVVDPTLTVRAPTFEVTDSRADQITVRMRLPALDLEEFEVEGTRYHAFTISGGGLRGEGAGQVVPEDLPMGTSLATNGAATAAMAEVPATTAPVAVAAAPVAEPTYPTTAPVRTTVSAVRRRTFRWPRGSSRR